MSINKIRETIKSAAPDAVERISWRMPTFWQKQNLVHFAASKKHIGLFPGDMTDSPFLDRLEGYKTSKGTMHFPLDKPIDYNLIEDIVKWRVSCVE